MFVMPRRLLKTTTVRPVVGACWRSLLINVSEEHPEVFAERPEASNLACL